MVALAMGWGSLLWGIVGGAIGGVGTDFIRSPFRKFWDLKGEVREKMHLYANVSAKWKTEPDDPNALIEVGILKAEEERLAEAEKTFRELASRIRSFRENERIAAWLVGMCGYNLERASAGLFGMSNALNVYGENRAFQLRTVEQALKFKRDN